MWRTSIRPNNVYKYSQRGKTKNEEIIFAKSGQKYLNKNVLNINIEEYCKKNNSIALWCKKIIKKFTGKKIFL